MLRIETRIRTNKTKYFLRPDDDNFIQKFYRKNLLHFYPK